MRVINIPIADSTFQAANDEANLKGLEITALCSSILTEHFDCPPKNEVKKSERAEEKEESNDQFDVRTCFQGFPEKSIMFAEIFLKAAYEVDPSIKVRKYGKSAIDIRDNFVRIEALLVRKRGIRVSFYGDPTDFQNRPPVLTSGMSGYSRAVVLNEEDLKSVIPLVRQSKKLKQLKGRT